MQTNSEIYRLPQGIKSMVLIGGSLEKKAERPGCPGRSCCFDTRRAMTCISTT